MTTVGFHHGALCDTYEKQANDQGFTFGKDAEWVQQVGFGLVCAHIHGCITDGEYDKILQRFQRRILLKKLNRLPEREGQGMKRTGDAEFFDGKCPYTGKPCYEWECNTCEVEPQERSDKE